jgi:hypothetical protein
LHRYQNPPDPGIIIDARNRWRCLESGSNPGSMPAPDPTERER